MQFLQFLQLVKQGVRMYTCLENTRKKMRLRRQISGEPSG